LDEQEIPDIDGEEDLERLELEDQAETVGKLTPREYARLRGLTPQIIYYYIRNNVLKLEMCVCGRKVIDVADTDEILTRRKDGKG
jgi:hypothetical protein